MTRRLLASILLASAWSVGGVAAHDPGTSMFTFGGFGTIGVVHTDATRADYTASAYQAVGAGYTRAVSPDVDSRIAGQITATFNPRLSAVLQVVAEQNYDDSYRPQVQWANVKYQVTPDFSVRVGRTAVSIFLYSDSRKIGYANPWVRPPPELYTLVPITSNDGVDAVYRVAFGTATNTLQASTGRSNSKFPIANDGGAETVDSRDQLIVVDSLQGGFGTLRFTYGQGHVTIPQLLPFFECPFRSWSHRSGIAAGGGASGYLDVKLPDAGVRLVH